ncbi:MAG: methyltransferase domain-containing protein [Maricaulaceae bacterium]|jgi:predicted methyltransferase
MKLGVIAKTAALGALAACAACASMGDDMAADMTDGMADAAPDYILAAVADPMRPEGDVFRDGRRKPAEVVAFAGVEPGMTVAELIPGNGYYTRILARAVGPEGTVYTLPFTEPRRAASEAIDGDEESYPNVELVDGALQDFALPEQVDLVWTTNNYHDVRQAAPLINRAAFNALKPGGIYFIVDHHAVSGQRDEAIGLHRIDVDLVKEQVIAAGFVLDAESDILRNPEDDLTLQVFERDLNRNTDRFVLRFRKPAE